MTKPKVQIKDIGELIQGGSEIYWQSFVYDDSSGNIVLEQNKGNIQAIGGSDNTVLYSLIGAPSIIKTTTVSPLSPVIIDYNNDVDAVKILLENSGYKEGDVVIIPAIFLKYGLDKIEDRAKEKSTLLALNTVTIATGMPVILQGATLAKRVWAAAEVAGALGDIAVNNQYIENKYPELKQTINAYNGVMGLIAVKNLVTSKGAKNLYNAAHSTVKTAFQNRNEFKSIIVAKYLDWKTLTTNLDNLSDAERKLIAEQEKVWKALGIVDKLSDVIYRNIKYEDFIKTFKATDEQYKEAYRLWGEEKWTELYQYFKNNNINYDAGISNVWPPFYGSKNVQKIEIASQLKGKVFDRFQEGKYADGLGGSFASPVLNSSEGVEDLIFTYDSRALANQIKEGTYYYKFRIKDDVPSLIFEYGEAIPWFNLQGTADQIKSSLKFNDILDHLEIIEKLKFENGKWINAK